eukprot:jgi/Chrzof1/12594/Cz07g00100.t1
MSHPAPQVWSQYTSHLDIQHGKRPPPDVGGPSFAAAASTSRGSCILEVSGPLVVIYFVLEGCIKVSISTSLAPGSSSHDVILPWGYSLDSSPEGWAAGLLKLHWYVYSMRTPVTYTLTMYNSSNSNNKGGQTVPRRSAAAHPSVGRSLQQAKKDGSSTWQGSGWAHLEKNWGDRFPRQWVWAQGTAGQDARSSFVLAGGHLPMQSQWQGPVLFAFSYHSNQLNITSDAWHPAVPARFEPAACAGSLSLTLVSLRYTVVLDITAPRESFCDLPCPLPDGFQIYSEESFQGVAHIRITETTPWTEATRGTGSSGTSANRISSVFHNVALEFGGYFKCQH